MLHPGLVLILTGLLIILVPAKNATLRRILMMVGPVLSLIATWQLHEGVMEYQLVPGLTLELMHVDQLARIFVIVFSFTSLMAGIYTLNTKNKWETVAEAVYAGSSISVVLAGDYITMIIFWELMALSSWLIVMSNRTLASRRAGFRYLLMHMFGGNMLLAGVILKVSQGSLAISSLAAGAHDAAYWLFLIGVGVNAVLPPFNSWIADAYPEATIGGTVYMGSYTTKVGIYALIRLFAGTEMLLIFGTFMAIYGACMALIENDLRRLFCYHIISQLGYMITSLACGGALGVDGAAAHAFNHILYKGTLLMCAGAVVAATGRRKITELGGLYKQMPLTAFCFLIASFAISGVPLLNGFVSKAVIMHAVHHGGFEWAAWLLTIASVGTWLSVALKVNWFVFFGPCDNIPKADPVPLNRKIAMVMGAASCAVTGLFPKLVYGLTPFQSDGHPFTFDHVAEYISLFVASSVVFFLLRKKMAPHEAETLNFDWIYRKPLAWIVTGISRGLYAFMCWCDVHVLKNMQGLGRRMGNPYEWTKNSASAAIRNWSFENEDHAIGAAIRLSVVVFAAMMVVGIIVVL